MKPAPISILLIGSDAADASAVCQALGDDPEDAFTLECATLTEGLGQLHTRRFAAVLIDLTLHGSHGIADFEQVSRAAPHVPILVISSADNRDIAREAVNRGGQDCLEKGHLDSYSLPRAIRHAIQRNAVEETLSSEQQRAEITLNSIGDAVMSIDISGNVEYLNPVAERMTGWSRQEALGRPIGEICPILDGDTRQPARNPLEQALQLQRVVGLRPHCLLVRRDGTETAIEDSASPIFDAAGQAIGAVMVFRDVSETRALALRATHLAQHDFLTELPNRLLLNDRLTQALVLARRHGHYVAVLFVDLDQFKLVNDTFGHLTGDALLQAVAERLVTCVRTSDTVSRLGGDEFMVVLSEVKHVADAAAIAQKIIARLATPYDINQRELHVTASVGIAIYPHDGSDAKTLITNADSAMYRAKKAGSNRYHFSDAQDASS